MKKLLLLGLIFSLSISIYAGKRVELWNSFKAKKYDSMIVTLEKERMKGAEEYYLLGKAYLKKQNKEAAFKAWNECLQIVKKTKKNKWDFLLPPKKSRSAGKTKLTKAQKKKFKDKFQEQFQELSAIMQRSNRVAAKDLKTDAKKLKAKGTMLNKKADAKTEAIKGKQKVFDNKMKAIDQKHQAHKNKMNQIKEKQKVANRKAKNGKNRGMRPAKRRGGKGSTIGAIIVGIIILLFIVWIVIKVKNGEVTVVEGDSGYDRRRVGDYDIYYNDDPFDMGGFYFEGRYWDTQDMFYDEYGYYYSNRMYADNYDRWGTGQGSDAIDNEIMNDIDEADKLNNEILDDIDDANKLNDEIEKDVNEREELRNEAAEVEYEADNKNIDAERLEEDADEYEDSSNVFDDEDDGFEDDTDEEEFDEDDF